MSDEGLDVTGLRTLAAAVRHGTFEAAAATLHVTPSAVSQRVAALERRHGRVLLVRRKPVRATSAGEVLMRLAAQIELLEREAAVELGASGVSGVEGQPAPWINLPVVVNADSLATWLLPALVAAASRHRVTFELLREDEGHSTGLLRQGHAVAAVTADPSPVPGCRRTRLGRMRYLPLATPEYRSRYLPRGPTVEALGQAPVVTFDRKDPLQRRMLRKVTRQSLEPPTHYVPASRDFADAIAAGLGWGMVPESWAGAEMEAGTLVRVFADAQLDVSLSWVRWRVGSPVLDDLTKEVQAATSVHLLP